VNNDMDNERHASSLHGQRLVTNKGNQ